MNDNITHRKVNGIRISLWRGLNLWFAWPTDTDYPIVEGVNEREAIAKLFVALDELERNQYRSAEV